MTTLQRLVCALNPSRRREEVPIPGAALPSRVIPPPRNMAVDLPPMPSNGAASASSRRHTSRRQESGTIELPPKSCSRVKFWKTMFQKKQRREEPSTRSRPQSVDIGLQTNVRHTAHASFDPNRVRYTGLPSEFMSKAEVAEAFKQFECL